MMITITAGPNDANRRLDRFLRQYFDKAPLSMIYRMIRKDVKVNGRRAGREELLREGDEIRVYISDETAAKLRSERRVWHVRKQFKVLYEDEQVLFVAKPFGLLTHGDRTEKKNTLINQVEGYLLAKGDYVPARENHFRPAAVNRLDRNTTGIVVFGKTQEALQQFTALMRDKEAVDKEYLAIVAGELRESLTLRDRMTRDEEENKSRILKETLHSGESADAAGGATQSDCTDTAARSDCTDTAEQSDCAAGKWMETVITPVRTSGRYTLVRVRILTGRTHQIRLHLAEAGYPIVGDPKYGSKKVNEQAGKICALKGQLLHCAAMTFHKGPLAGRTVECPPPDSFTMIQRALLKETATGNEQ